MVRDGSAQAVGGLFDAEALLEQVERRDGGGGHRRRVVEGGLGFVGQGGVGRGDVGRNATLLARARDRPQETLAVFGPLLLAHAVAFEETLFGRGAAAGHVAQGAVAEDDVRGDALLLGDLSPQRAQLLEELTVDALPRRGVGAAAGIFRRLLHRLQQPRGVLAA